MTLKKFSIFTAIITGIILVITITLSCIKVNNSITGTPDKIICYLKSSTGVECDEKWNKEHYNKITNLYKQMTNISIIDYLAKGDAVDTYSTQDFDNTRTYPDSQEKNNNYCLELIFKDKQRIVVEIDGDTKIVEFYSLLFVIKKSILSSEFEMFFSQTEDFESSKSYYNCKNPIYLRANGNKLIKYLEYMETTQAD